jgi:hypothetical protein
MKTIILSIGISVLLMTACNNDNKNGSGDRAVDNARNYMRTELGDGANYEEVSWGKVEPRKVDWKNSKRYRLYQDTLGMMQDHLNMMNDSLDIEMRAHGNTTPYYKTLQMRRDGYQMYYNTYSNSEGDLNRTYDGNPEYDGYWIHHEYKVDGQPRNAYIRFDDTTNYNATDVIYEQQ